MDVSISETPSSPSSPTSFHTAQEFRTPSSFPSRSEFEGFSDDDTVSLRTSTVKSPPPELAPLLAPPTCNADGSVKTFPSLQAALSYCQNWARDHGYAIRKCRTKCKGRGKEKILYKVYIECECAGKKQATKVPEQFRVRKDQSSKACGCPFGGSIIEKNGSWSIRINQPNHEGHLALLQPSYSAIHRRTARSAQVEHARNGTAVAVQKEARPQSTPASWARELDWTRSIEDCLQHLPPLPSGLPGFQRVKFNDITENLGPQELFPEPFWVDELWHEDVRLAPEVSRLYNELGKTRDRMIRELLYRTDAERMREEARRTYRERQAQQEVREEAVGQGQRRSGRG